MDMRKGIVRAAMVSALLGLGAAAKAQDEGMPPPFAPLPEHKVLAGDVGTWDAAIKTYMAGPDAAPDASKGSEVNTLMPGGMWLLSEFKAEFGGRPFTGRGQFGYDPIKKAYVGTWIDSMSPSITNLEGKYDAKAKTMTYEGEGVDGATKVKYHQKMVTTTKPDGSRVFTLFMAMGDAKEAKFMEVTYTRTK